MDEGTGVANPPWALDERDIHASAACVFARLFLSVTRQQCRHSPIIDPDDRRDAIRSDSELCVITPTQHACQLNCLLRPSLNAHGGPVRLRRPIRDLYSADPTEHPIFTTSSGSDADRVSRDVAGRPSPQTPPPPAATDVDDVVSAVLKHGVEIKLTTAHATFATKAYSARRLHYWRPRGGCGGLLKVGVHDDCTIP